MLQQLHDVQALAQWLRPRCAGALRTDHRQLRPGDALLAWPGRHHDARAHAQQALAQGAAACVVEAEGAQRFELDDPRIAAFEGLRRHAGELADLVLGQPSAKLQVVAVTGTNGKTSCAWWVAQALSAMGRRCGVIGTLGAGEPATRPQPMSQPPRLALESTGLTTPDAVALHAQLRRLADAGVGAVAIEASSIGIEEHRLAGVRIAVAAFTNFSRDHLDYHGSMAAYWSAKRRLFDVPGLACAVVNVDDACGLRLAQELQAQARPGDGLRLWRVSAHDEEQADLHAHDVLHAPDGMRLVLREGDSSLEVRCGLIGEFNVHNLLVVAGCLRALGHPLEDLGPALSGLQPVPGRMQRVTGKSDADSPQVVVDYAHTPDALEKVLRTLRPLATARDGHLWCVFGCGGNRDATKRPLMGDVAARLAHRVVVTSDNPRDEDPAAIIDQVLAGMPPMARAQALALPDRAEAISRTIFDASEKDVVLIAGKGHEPMQEIAGVRRPFDDALQAEAALEARGRGRCT